MAGLFSINDDAFARFLSRIGGDRKNSDVFAARNFQLDEGVTPDRFDSYVRAGGVADHPTLADWRGAHGKYLRHKVFIDSGHGKGPSREVDPNDPIVCPETFRRIDPASPFHRSDPKVLLVRVVEISFVARRSGVGADEIKQLAQNVVASEHKNADANRDLDAIFTKWCRNIDVRPVFAGCWGSVDDLFKSTPADDQPGWADELRDMLGLRHLDPGPRGQRQVDVIVFRYAVKKVPRLRSSPSRDSRPLVPPTVLDGELSEAFCPGPKGELTGYTVDLGMTGPPIRLEVLHPALALTAADVFRVGEIRRTIGDGVLPEARGYHLLCVRELTGRQDYAAETDNDLIGP